MIRLHKLEKLSKTKNTLEFIITSRVGLELDESHGY